MITFMEKQLLFSVSSKDLYFEYFTCGSKGGQHANRNKTGVRIKHPPSNAVAESREYKSQLQNKQAAFKRLTETKEFRVWHRIETARRCGKRSPEQIVDSLMDRIDDFKIEIKDNKGNWKAIPIQEFLLIS